MNTMNRYVCCALLLCALVIPCQAQQSDKLLSILKQELKSNFAQLQKQNVKPYYMSYRAEDKFKKVISSSFGTLSSNQDLRSCNITPQIRLGSKQLDNFKYYSQGYPSYDGRSAAEVTIPYEDDATAGITTNIWNATLARYKYALAFYEQAKSKAATSTADEDKAPCFSEAPVEHYYEQPLNLDSLKLNDKVWEARLNAISAVFKADPNLKEGSASLDYGVSRTYFVNTDGTDVVQNRVSARLMLSVEAVAEDGMSLPLYQDFFTFSPDSLPSQETVVAAAKDLLRRVEALRKAPVANPYTGPAVLSGPASGVFFHEIFGHRLEGHRLKEGGETFKNMVGKQVLPTPFQVYCDPTLRHYAGTDMNGYYLYDSEGVKARRVDNVVNGTLKEFLMSRVPLDGFPQSNGHGRASGANDPVSRQSNLVVETKQPYTDAQLRQMLIREAKKQGKDYGYFFKTVTNGYTMTGEGGTINSFNVTPVEVYRVFVNGKPDELVRGVSLIGTPLSMFSHIQAGGNTPATFTGVCGAESGWVPVTATSPAIFVSQIETQRIQKTGAMPPVLSAPAFTFKDAGDTDKMVFNAMKDEMHRTTDSLRVAEAKAPFWVGYGVTRYRSFDITGEYGGISLSNQTPWQTNIITHVLLGNFKRCSDIPGQPLLIGSRGSDDMNYAMLRRALWSSSDQAYKSSVMMQAQKESYLNQNPLPSALEKLPDMQHSAPCTYIVNDSVPYDIDMARLNGYAKELSAIFNDYPYLFNGEVKISGDEVTSYRATSENVNIKQPHNRVTIKVSARFEDDQHLRMSDELKLSYERPSEIPALDTLKARVRKFADDCMALRNAELMTEAYKGPVMFENDAVKEAFVTSYLSAGDFYAQPSLQENNKGLGPKIGKKIMDERITITNETGLTTYQGQPLYGHYAVDADGFTPTTPMTLVDKGVFMMMLNRATPAQYAPKSTASARFCNEPGQAVPMVGVGTLHVQATGTTADEKMEKELIKRAKKEKLSFAYIITLPNNCTCLRLEKIDVKTGQRTLVKSDMMALPSSEQMKKLVAISNKEIVRNSVEPYTYSTIVPASIIVDDMELGKATMKPEKAPALIFPLQRK